MYIRLHSIRSSACLYKCGMLRHSLLHMTMSCSSLPKILVSTHPTCQEKRRSRTPKIIVSQHVCGTGATFCYRIVCTRLFPSFIGITQHNEVQLSKSVPPERLPILWSTRSSGCYFVAQRTHAVGIFWSHSCQHKRNTPIFTEQQG